MRFYRFTLLAVLLLGARASAQTTRTFSLAPPVLFSGQIHDLSIGGHLARQFVGQNSQMDFVAIGSALSVQCNYAPEITVKACVDGGAWATVPATGGVWAWSPVFAGLPERAHRITIKHWDANGQNFYVDRSAAFRVTGAHPALSGAGGFGPQYSLSAAPFATYSAPEGGWQAESAAGYSSPALLTTVWTDAMIRFRARCSTVRVWMHQSGETLRFQMDGSDRGEAIRVPNSGQFGWVTVAEGLNAGVTHEYSFSTASVPGGKTYLYGVMLIGGAGWTRARLPARPTLAFYGDSITTAVDGTADDASQGYVHRLGLRLGVAVHNRGVRGSTIHAFSAGGHPTTDQAGEARIEDLTRIRPVPRLVVILYGTNDYAQVGGAESVEEFGDSYRRMLAGLRSAMPSTILLCMGLLPRRDNSHPTSGESPWNEAIRAAVGSLRDQRVWFLPTTDWLDDREGTPDLHDEVHPTGAGYAKIVQRLLPSLR